MTNTVPYWKRLAISTAIVIAASSLVLMRGSLSDAAGATWLWPAVITDVLKWNFSFPVHPIFWALLTLAILAAAAKRRNWCIAATTWFALNAFGGLWFLSIYDGHS